MKDLPTSERQEAAGVAAVISRPGRRSSEYKIWLSSLLAEKTHRAAFKRAIIKDKHPHFMAATKHAAAYAEGMPIQAMVDLTPREPAHLAASALVEAIPRLVSILGGAAQHKAKLLEAIEVDAAVVD